MKSIRLKMLLSFGVSLLLILAGLGSVMIFTLNNVMLDYVENVSDEIVDARANEIGRLVDGYMGEIKTYTKDDVFMNFTDWDSIKKRVDFLAKDMDSSFETLVFSDLNGQAYMSNGANADLSERNYYQAIVKNNQKSFVSEAIVSKATGNKVFMVAYEVLNSANQKIGMVAASIKLDTLSAIAESMKVGNKGYGWIVDNTGMVIAHPDDTITMSLNVLKSAEAGFKNLDTAGKAMIENEKGTSVVTRPDGVDEVLTFNTIPSTPHWALGIAVTDDEMYERADQMVTTLLIILGILVICILGMVFVVSTMITKPLVTASKHLDVIANADFSQQVPEKMSKRKDEIGGIARSIEQMQTSVKSVVQGVIDEAVNIGSSTESASKDMYNLSIQIDEVSATTEEMAAGMEETAASAEEMNATSTEIAKAIESIASKAEGGARAAAEINKRAQELKERAVKSQNETETIQTSVDNDLREAIQQSKAVEQINMLTESILQITNQTNLLALNAAIEAARAGEAGRGFAVVADEIRKLADDSKNAVTDIQNVTRLVVSSVEHLIHSSQKVLDYIGTTVMKDYESMVDTGEQYCKDAGYIEELVTDFSATSQEVTASVQSLIQAINEISLSNNEAAGGAQNIAQRTVEVADKSSNVVQITNVVKASSEKLSELVSRFKV